MNILNKYTALLIVLFILLIGYYFTVKRKENTTDKKKRKSKKKSSRRKKSSRKSPKSGQTDDSEETNDDDDDSVDEEQNISDDAEELYSLTHEALCKGIQQEEFEEIVGDLADSIVFIELKQLYNQCTEKNMDPMRTITIEDYQRILKKEKGSE